MDIILQSFCSSWYGFPDCGIEIVKILWKLSNQKLVILLEINRYKLLEDAIITEIFTR